MSENKSVFNWTFCQLLKCKTQWHESLSPKTLHCRSFNKTLTLAPGHWNKCSPNFRGCSIRLISTLAPGGLEGT